jgi:trans-aconitate methyltransferase
MSDWKAIWNRRQWNGTDTVLEGLIAADGFDQGAGKIAVEEWERYTGRVSTWLKLAKDDALFDVGCGSGAFLYPFYRSGHRVGGIDYSDALIAVARRTMAGMDFSAAEARELNDQETYDAVVSNGVFHYFPDLGYAEQVLHKMIKKARKAVAVLEVPNLDLQEQSERARAAALPPGEYESKYTGLRHQYYSKSWFEEMGARYDCQVRILDQQIEGYGNNRFRFNALFYKTA